MKHPKIIIPISADNKQVKDIIGKDLYFVHKGTWENSYEWRIQKVKVTGVNIDEKSKLYVEFNFNCCGYEYPYSYLKDTFAKAKSFAIRQINAEKKKQIESIKKQQ